MRQRRTEKWLFRMRLTNMFTRNLVIIKEIQDAFDGIELTLELMRQSASNTLKTLEGNVTVYPSEEVVRLANSVIKKTRIIRHLLKVVDESAEVLLKPSEGLQYTLKNRQ